MTTPPLSPTARVRLVVNVTQGAYGLYKSQLGKRRAFWSLNEDILKITILKTNTPYPSRKIRRICACTHQRPQRNKAQYAVSRETQYAVFKIWNEYNILEDIKRGPYSKKSPIRRDLDNSTSNVLIPLDSWTSGLLVYKSPLSVTDTSPNSGKPPLLPTPIVSTTNTNTTPLAIKWISPEERQERLDKRLCFNYDSKWMCGHKCPDKFLLHMAEEDDNPGREIPADSTYYLEDKVNFEGERNVMTEDKGGGRTKRVSVAPAWHKDFVMR
ncbi:hypothetical protein Tco_1064702 [Tanacetum coccineum]